MTHENSPVVQSVHDKRLCEGYYVDAQQQRERAEAAEAENERLQRLNANLRAEVLAYRKRLRSEQPPPSSGVVG